MVDKALFSGVVNNPKSSDKWGSPLWLFNHFNSIHKFTIDLAADASNAKCPIYYDEEQNSLIQDWVGRGWLNPPHSMNQKFVDKCRFELERNYAAGTFLSIHLLIPARTDTKYFHSLMGYANDISFIKGRLKYDMPDTGKVSKNSAPFPSCVIHLNTDYMNSPDSTLIFTIERKRDGSVLSLPW